MSEKKKYRIWYTAADGTHYSKFFERDESYSDSDFEIDSQDFAAKIQQAFNPNQDQQKDEAQQYIALPDGKVWDGHGFYGVDSDTFQVHQLIFDAAEQQSRGTPSRWRYFAHRESAEKYADENKPAFSKQRVRDIIDSSMVDFPGFANSTFRKLIKRFGIE